jgi:2-polyprenyl-6-methoxyphenol hydroxylase-like FAD-dependent oxidoreductase
MSAAWDVVVVGGRAAGASTAMLLARAGLRVLCIERTRLGSDALSTHALMRGGTLQLAKWDLLDAVTGAGTPAIRHTLFHYGADWVPVPIRPAAGVDAVYAPRRTLIDRLLAEAAAAAGAHLEFWCSVAGLEQDRAGRVTGVSVRSQDGSVRAERARLVIGADGRHSLVAQAVGAASLFNGRSASAFVYGYFRGLPAAGYEWFYGPRAGAGIIPTNDGLSCVFVGAPPTRLARLVQDCGPGNAVRVIAGEWALRDRLAGAKRPRLAGAPTDRNNWPYGSDAGTALMHGWRR